MLKQLKNGIIHGIGILLVIGLAGISYSAWPTSVDRAVENTPLTAAKYNQIVDRLESIQPEQLATAWVNFDGTSCPGNICDINSSYNISSVTKNSTGQYRVHFLNSMDSIDYVINSSGKGEGSASTNINTGISGNLNLLYFDITSLSHYDFQRRDSNVMHVTVFGGKNY